MDEFEQSEHIFVALCNTFADGVEVARGLRRLAVEILKPLFADGAEVDWNSQDDVWHVQVCLNASEGATEQQRAAAHVLYWADKWIEARPRGIADRAVLAHRIAYSFARMSKDMLLGKVVRAKLKRAAAGARNSLKPARDKALIECARKKIGANPALKSASAVAEMVRIETQSPLSKKQIAEIIGPHIPTSKRAKKPKVPG